MPNYKSFDDVLKELEMDEDELKRLVSEGQIRAFRDDDRMKFRSEDVKSLARQRQSGGPGATDLDLGETAMGGAGLEVVEEETDETLLDLGSLSQDQDFEDTGATSVPTVELADSGGDEKEGTLTEELVFDETDELGGLDFGTGDADATQKIDGGLSLDDDELGLQTEPVETKGKGRPKLPSKAKKAAAADELDELDDLDSMDDMDGASAPPPRQFGGPMGAPGPVQIHEQVRYVEIVPNEGIAWKVLTGVTFLLVMFALVTLPAMGMRSGTDPLGAQFFGSTAYSLYTKSPNTGLAQEPYKVEGRATAVSVGQSGKTVIWPGMDVIRSFSGYSVDSSSAESDAGEAAPPAESAAPAEGGE